MKAKQLEKGQILELNETLFIEDNIVLHCSDGLNIPIGTLINITWFPSSKSPKMERIVYLGDFKFGIRQLVPMRSEFLALHPDDQESELMKMCLNS